MKLEPLVRKTFQLKPVLHGVPRSRIPYRQNHRHAVEDLGRRAGEPDDSAEPLQTMPIDIQEAKENMTVEPKIDYQGQPVKLLEKNIAVRISLRG